MAWRFMSSRNKDMLMASLSNLTDLDLERQVAALSRELSALKRDVAKRGGAYYDDGRDAAMDYLSDFKDMIGDRLPGLRRRAHALESTARDHPATAAAVGLVVLGLLATVVLSRRRD
jgi:ElaB/YqjD/DUF883 family membrane-anchored ribosome-binding protein